MEHEYTNDETEAVFMAIRHEPNVFLYWRTMAQDFEFDTQELANEIKREINRNAPVVQVVYGDLLGAALGRVNWYEVADKFLGRLRDSDNALNSETIQ
jgi:hypothetical protein